MLLLFLLTGGVILGALGISTTSVAIAGGVLLMVIAIRMVFPSPHGILGEEPSGEPFIVRLAVPLTAGPSAIAMVMLFMSTEPERWVAWIGSVVAAWLPAAAILAGSGAVSRVLGRRGLIAIERLFGMLLVAIAVQILINGVMPLISAT
ncbi:MAG: MarC family protein [Planctomycetota bacterium]